MVSLRSLCPPEKKQYARQMRKNPTPAEAFLWESLCRKKLGVRVGRQRVIRGYIVDFYIPAWSLAIEVDGSIHATAEIAARDKARSQHLAAIGIKVLRFTNEQVTNDRYAVVKEIRAEGAKTTPYAWRSHNFKERKDEISQLKQRIKELESSG